MGRRRVNAAEPTEPEPTELPAGSFREWPSVGTFGHFEVLGRATTGETAEVYLAREHTAVGGTRLLALKRILSRVADDDFIQLFLDESSLAIQLHHPNICHMYETGQAPEGWFIATEWVDGVRLDEVVARAEETGGIPASLAAAIIGELAEALEYAHGARDALGRPLGLVHRSVSLHNVMVSFEGRVKLLDLGITEALTRAPTSDQSAVQNRLAFMAPEQALAKQIDSRSDVFGLGVCLYQCLTGVAPFSGETAFETLRAVADMPSPTLESQRPGLPSGLEPIVRKALEKSPEDRTQTAGEVRAALESWRADVDGDAIDPRSIRDLMHKLFADEIERGPDLDRSPFVAAPIEESAPGSSAGLASGPIAAEAPERQAPTSSSSRIAVLVVLIALALAGAYFVLRDAT